MDSRVDSFLAAEQRDWLRFYPNGRHSLRAEAIELIDCLDREGLDELSDVVLGRASRLGWLPAYLRDRIARERLRLGFELPKDSVHVNWLLWRLMNPASNLKLRAEEMSVLRHFEELTGRECRIPS